MLNGQFSQLLGATIGKQVGRADKCEENAAMMNNELASIQVNWVLIFFPYLLSLTSNRILLLTLERPNLLTRFDSLISNYFYIFGVND